MKSNFFKGITFKTWFYFSTFSVGLLVLLWILQISFLKPYYKSIKVSAIENIVEKVSFTLESNENISDSMTDIAYKNNICFAIYRGDGSLAQSLKDGIGKGCFLSASSYQESLNVRSVIEEIKESLNNEVIRYLSNDQFGEVMLYAKKIDNPLTDYYLIINSPIEPGEYSVNVIQEQYLLMSLVVLILATVISFLISRGMSNPIIKITNNAKELARGNYNVRFHDSEGSFQEVQDLAETLNHAADELSKTDELRRDLIANVSHDIKTPLTMIKAYAEMIQDLSGDNKKKRDEHLAVIITEANHLDRLVVDMMELSRIQSGNIELNTKQFDLVGCVKSILKVFEPNVKKENIVIKTKFMKKAKVRGDEIKLGQVIYNFLSNAIKHVGDNKQISVKVEQIHKKIRVSITDYGIGISAEDLPYIWDRYYKIDKNFKRNQDSTGLGLAISKGLLEAHNASYGVESEEGKGSTFWFELPQQK